LEPAITILLYSSFIFSFSKSSFLDDSFCPKDLGHPREFKKGAIKLKLGTLVDWMNTWGFFLHFFFKIFIINPRNNSPE